MDLLNKVAGVRGSRGLLSPFVIKLLLIMFFMEFVKGALIITILPDYMGTVLGLSAVVIGFSLSMQYIGDSLLRSPIGWLIDRIGYRWCMLFGALLTFASVLILYTQSSMEWIIAACVLLGAGTSPLWPAVIAGATEAVGDQAKGTLMSVIYLSWLTGIGLGPVVINFFIHYSYDAAFRLLIGIMAGVTAVALLLPNRWKGKGAERSAKPQRVRGNRSDRKAAAAGLSRFERIIRYLNEVRRSIKVGPLFYVALFAQTFSIGLITPVLTLYARSVLELSPFEYSLFLVFGGGIAVLSLIPMGRMVDRHGTSRFLHAGFLISSLSLLLFTYFREGAMLYVLVATLGIGYAMIIPAWNALIAAVIPQKERGTVWGFILTIEGLGTISGPIVSGWLWDRLGFHAPFVASGCVILLLFVFHILLSVRTTVRAGE